MRTFMSLKDSARSPHRRVGISVLVIAVVVFAAIGIAFEFVFLPNSTSTSNGNQAAATTCTTTSFSGTSPSTYVNASITQWVSEFNTRNVQGLSNLYSTCATVSWTGNAVGLAGTYSNQGNIRILYGSSIGKTLILNASISNYVEKIANPYNINTTMTMTMRGNSSVLGKMNATIAATQQWNYNGQQWQIVKENWNYLVFETQYHVSSTTFPQWGVMQSGQNPNLVSEKSFEWHVGPWVAASVYAVLFAVLAIGLLTYKGRSRSDRLS
jgi:hypothetical protein